MHGLHAVFPLSSWNSPAEHGVQTDAPALKPYVPGAHGVSVAAPTEQNEPAEQVMH